MKLQGSLAKLTNALLLVPIGEKELALIRQHLQPQRLCHRACDHREVRASIAHRVQPVLGKYHVEVGSASLTLGVGASVHRLPE